MTSRSSFITFILFGIALTAPPLSGEIVCCIEDGEPPEVGNFSLPASQQPSTLFGFGGNIIDEGESQVSLYVDEFIGKRRKAIDLLPNYIYGINDRLSILLALPSTPYLKERCDTSRGVEDIYAQLEYAFYNRSTCAYVDQGTVIAGLLAPTGSSHKSPPTGYGSPSIFLGGTYYRMMVDWFWFGAPGSLLTTPYKGTRFGNQYLYQFGFGCNMLGPNGWIYAWMVEADGLYSTRNRIRGRSDRNTGGHVVFITPSLWISSQNIALQFGVSFPAYQRLNGHQGKFNCALNFNIAWSIY